MSRVAAVSWPWGVEWSADGVYVPETLASAHMSPPTVRWRRLRDVVSWCIGLQTSLLYTFQ